MEYLDEKERLDYDLENGMITVPLDNMKLYTNTDVELDYVGDKTGASYYSKDVYIEQPPVHINITQKSDSEFQINMETDATGRIVLSVDGKNYEKIISNGQTTVTVSKLSPGLQKVIVTYSGDRNYSTTTSYILLNIKDNTKIIASNLAMMYNDGSKYSVKVYGNNGKAVGKNQVVTIKINKKTYKVKTNKNGYAILKIPSIFTPGKYKITATYKGQTIKNTLKVKQVLKSKKVTVKKTAKKFVLKATLKKGKKVIKGKWVTFKFNGKKYKAKTNSKGIAQKVISKKIIKKLKKGKKYTYSAIFLKEIVNKKVTVKK
jgi:hypothetical protein